MKGKRAIVKVYEREGYANNLEQGELCKVLENYGTGVSRVFGLKSKVEELVYEDEVNLISHLLGGEEGEYEKTN